MILRKYTDGYVCQHFDSETGKCFHQEFVAKDKIDPEVVNEKEERIYDEEILKKLNHSFTMRQSGE